MLKIALTGSIATGKSTVLARFAEHGIPAYSADSAVHELYAGEAAPLVETLFPGTVRDGVVDRRALSSALAREPERITELEEVVHPLVREKAMAFFQAARMAGNPLAIIEIPLFFETGSQYAVDRVVVTVADPDIQRQRVLERPGQTAEKLDLMLSRQLSQSEKRARADYVIDTSGTMADSLAQTDAVIAALQSQALQEFDRDPI